MATNHLLGYEMLVNGLVTDNASKYQVPGVD